jgi:hypothetical protein
VRFTKQPNERDILRSQEIAGQAPVHWIPPDELLKGDRFFKDGLHLINLTHYYRFYFPRTLHVLAFLWKEIEQLNASNSVKNRVRFILTSMLDRNLTIRNRFVINKHNPQGRINGPLANTLYVPGLSVEQNPFVALEYKSKSVFKGFACNVQENLISTQTLSSVQIPKNSIDYIFIDPPFGTNIMYSELNRVTEVWLRVMTNSGGEAIVSESQDKPIVQ